MTARIASDVATGWNLQYLVGFLLALLLGYASIEHFRNNWYFLNSVLKYQIVGGYFAVIIAFGLPAFIYFLAALLISSVKVRFALMASLLLFSIFALAKVYVITRGVDIACGCWGYSSGRITWTSVSLDVLAAFACVVGLIGWPIRLRPSSKLST